MTIYTHTFDGIELGESYYIRVKVYDTNNKYVEALSNVIALNYILQNGNGLKTQVLNSNKGFWYQGEDSNLYSLTYKFPEDFEKDYFRNFGDNLDIWRPKSF